MMSTPMQEAHAAGMTGAHARTLRVVVADDHAMVRDGLKRIIDSEPDMQVTGQATDGASTLASLKDADADVVLVDLTMPDTHGPSLVTSVRRDHPDLPILVVSMHDTPAVVRAALQAGATGYITKDANPDRLIEAIRAVVAGRRYVDPALQEALRRSPMLSPSVLSPRELQVLRMLAQGQSNTEVAATLHLSEKTVSTHKTNILAKLHLNTLVDLVRYADQNGLR